MIENIIEKRKQEFQNKIENIFADIRYDYELLNLDDDVNYMIRFDASDIVKGMPKLQALLYFVFEDSSVHINIYNIYKIKSNDDRDKFYKMLNDLNQMINFGAFYLSQDMGGIVYSSSIKLEDDLSDLTSNKISDLIYKFLNNLSILVDEITKIRKIKNEE